MSSRAAIAGVSAALCMAPAAHAAVTISTAATSNMSCVSGVCTPTAADAVLNVGDLESMLASGNVKLAAASEPVDVDVAASLSWVSTNTLTLDSYHAINVQQPVAVNGGGGLALITNDGGTGGQFAFLPGANVAFLNGAGSLTINGTAYRLVTDIATLASDIAANPSGSYALAGNYNAAPDGTYGDAPITTRYTGSFQGLGNTIFNLSIASGVKGANLGLFATIGLGANVADLTLQNAAVTDTGPRPGSIVGGLAAINEGTVFGVHVSGKISGVATSGGLIGANAGSLSFSSASGTVIGTRNVGGLTGNTIAALIDQCFADASASGSGHGLFIGGLIGYNDTATITNSYATGTVNGEKKARVGGLIGDSQAATVSASYAAGAVKGKSGSEVGGFLGAITLEGTYSHAYWDKTTSGTDSAAGNSKSVTGIRGLSDARLKASLPAGFDPTIWAESPSINNGLPYLINNPPQ